MSSAPRRSPRKPLAQVLASGENAAKTATKKKKNLHVYPVGTKVYKEFDEGWFFGEICKLSDDGLYFILYTDGDSEELEPSKVKALVRQAEEQMAEDSDDDEVFEAETTNRGHGAVEVGMVDSDDEYQPERKTKDTGQAKSTNVASKRLSSSSTASTSKRGKVAQVVKAKEALLAQPTASELPNQHVRSRLAKPGTQKTLNFFFGRPTVKKVEKRKAENDVVRVDREAAGQKDDDYVLEESEEEAAIAGKAGTRMSKKARPSPPPSAVPTSGSTTSDEDDDDFDADDCYDEDDVEDEDVDEDDRKPAAKPYAKKATAKPTAMKPTSKPSAKKPASSKKLDAKVVKKKNANGGTVGYDKEPYSGGAELPVISDIQQMFDDMVQEKLVKNTNNEKMLLGLLKKLKNRPLRVATMCSGTESPILALDMLQKAIQDTCRDHPDRFASVSEENGFDGIFQLEHIFSCEIEPFKQAYIERNFHPPLLFRDIRELGQDQAYTAYGAFVDVPNIPGCVDILIAGTSCVDYSNLNNQKKNMEEKGESGATFYGMITWIKKAQPPIVIIENVFGAPWDEKVEIFEELGYSATFLRLDTKDYYIPHTRQRGYLFAVKRQEEENCQDDRPRRWKELVTKLKRPASASLDDFILPNDDPRVLRGRARLTTESSSGDGDRAGRTDWTKCETRHQAARSLEELGDKRPLTEWSDSGNTAMPSFCWNEWCNAQVHRIHDLMDINTLRLAKCGIDGLHKTMVWNLSQNVDRDTMGKLGLCQCLTPTGVPFVTNRGGPLVGEELLMLQGIPVDDLLLTKETEENLKDLAGNAMSTTVVGACTLCALLLGHSVLPSSNGGSASGDMVPSLVPRPLAPASEVTVSQSFGEYERTTADLSPRLLSDHLSWKAFLVEASSSCRMCTSEGQEEAIPLDSLVKCRECGHTASVGYAYPPRKYEEHEYNSIDVASSRVEPASFRRKLLELLPMRVKICGFDLDRLDAPEDADASIWEQWLESVGSALTTAQDAPVEFRLTDLLRTHIWTAAYIRPDKARLEARISNSGVKWLLFAKSPPNEGPLKALLDRPVARMSVTSPSVAFDGSVSMLDGQWELCLPVASKVSVRIEGMGERVPSWRSRLGLKGGFETEFQYETLRIQVESPSVDQIIELKSKIDGDYKLLPKCGGACGSLRKKVGGPPNDRGKDMFFFLSSGRKTIAKDDAYIFSPCCHRTAYGEYREICLQIDAELGYSPVHLGGSLPEDATDRVVVGATLLGRWVIAQNAAMEAASSSNMDLVLPTSALRVPLQLSAWQICPELLSCTVQVSPNEDLVARCRKIGGSVEVNLQKSKKIFQEIAFATSRLALPGLFDNGHWLELDQEELAMVANAESISCKKCAPAKPRVKWTLVSKGNKTTFVPVEDGREAAAYERALKTRPQPWLVRLCVSTAPAIGDTVASLTLSIGCNAVSLVQRALGIFPIGTLARKSMIDLSSQSALISSKCTFEWRVVPHAEKVFSGFSRLSFTSNKQDEEAAQPPRFKKFNLRKEQLRSLSWMLKQESTREPFFEEEVTEAVLPSLNWRAEGRVRRPVVVRGGIIADEVGYGKTAITLGLIDSADEVNGTPPDPPEEYRSGYIPTKATLVFVPKHLMGQWPEEVKKFLGTSKKVCVIKDMTSLNKLSIDEVLRADIVIVSFAVLSGEKYFSRLARLSGVNPASLPTGSNGSRHFTAVYDECLEALPMRVGQIVHDVSNAYSGITQDDEAHKNRQADGSLRLDGKKTVYKNGKPTAKVVASDFKITAAEKDPWGLSSAGVKKDYRKMTCPPLEMFFWNRLVVDEFTYLAKKDRERVLEVIYKIKSSFRWCLSGTPKHADFNDISSLACLLGVHLGVDEVLPGVKLNKKYLTDRETTGLESLSHYLENRSLQWHHRRHELGQSFLNRFVRQNIAEIDEIPFEEHEFVVDLPPAERAIYMELETHLKSLEMNNKNAQKSKRKSTGDRENRMQKILQDSETGEEALLKCCSHFNMSASSTALETIDDIIKLRESEKRSLEKEMTDAVAAAFRQRQIVLDYQPDWMSVTVTGKGEVQDALGVYLTEVGSKKSIPHGADEEINESVDAIVRKGESDFEAQPTLFDSFFASSEGDDEDEDDGTRNKTKKKAPKKECPIDEVQIFALKQALRNHMHLVRSLGKELCGRIRSLRYIQYIRHFQRKGKGDENVFECFLCQKERQEVDEVGVLSCCGHAGCLGCLRKLAGEGHCIMPNCSARVNAAHIVSADKLGLDREDASGGRFGSKLTAVVKKVKEIIEQLGDRLIIFCQFDDLKDKVKEALASSHINSLEVKGTVMQQISTLSIFQKDKPDKFDARVLLLKMDDEQSAGLNLTNLNHAIFVHPLLAGSQQDYDAYETQAIGRIRRFGQKKTVHVWRFLAQDTIDTEIFAQRTSRAIADKSC